MMQTDEKSQISHPISMIIFGIFAGIFKIFLDSNLWNIYDFVHKLSTGEIKWGELSIKKKFFIIFFITCCALACVRVVYDKFRNDPPKEQVQINVLNNIINNPTQTESTKPDTCTSFNGGYFISKNPQFKSLLDEKNATQDPKCPINTGEIISRNKPERNRERQLSEQDAQPKWTSHTSSQSEIAPGEIHAIGALFFVLNKADFFSNEVTKNVYDFSKNAGFKFTKDPIESKAVIDITLNKLAGQLTNYRLPHTFTADGTIKITMNGNDLFSSPFKGTGQSDSETIAKDDAIKMASCNAANIIFKYFKNSSRLSCSN